MRNYYFTFGCALTRRSVILFSIYAMYRYSHNSKCVEYGNQQKQSERQHTLFGWPGKIHYSYSTKIDTVVWIVSHKKVAQLKIIWPNSTIQAVLTGHERYKTYAVQPCAQDNTIYMIPMKAEGLPRAPGGGPWPVLECHTGTDLSSHL